MRRSSLSAMARPPGAFDQVVKVGTAYENDEARPLGNPRHLEVGISKKEIEDQRKIFSETVAAKTWPNEKARIAFNARIIKVAANRGRKRWFEETKQVPLFIYKGQRMERDGTFVFRFQVLCDEDGNLTRPGNIY